MSSMTSSENFDKRENIIETGRLQYDLLNNDSKITYRKALDFMEYNKTFRKFLTSIFKVLPFRAYLWEVAPVTDKDADTTNFQFVITESKSLSLMAKDNQTFANHFKRSQNPYVTSFFNLGRDALLVAPLPATKFVMMERDYSHMGNFINHASDEQIDAFWIEVAKSMKERLSSSHRNPLWLSTAGHGVGWLHVRIDTTPKYYSYTPYRKYQRGKPNDTASSKTKSKSEIDEIFEAEENKRSSTNYGRKDKVYLTDRSLAKSLGKQESEPYTGSNNSRKRNSNDEPDREISNKGSQKYDWSISEGYNNHGQTMLYTFTYKDDILTYKDAIKRLKTDLTFLKIFSSVFKDCQHDYYKWELVPVDKSSASTTEFQVAFINMEGSHDASSSPRNFKSLLKTHNDEILVHQLEDVPLYFIAPSHAHMYKHIGDFVRNAPADIVEELWTAIAQALKQALERHPYKPVCLTSYQTSSVEPSVYVRIDSNPMGYKHPPYQKLFPQDHGDDGMDWD